MGFKIKMLKKFLFFIAYLIPIIISRPVCNENSNCVCDPVQVNLLHQNNWIVVAWDTGDCYFHNVVTRENVDNNPLMWSLEDQ